MEVKTAPMCLCDCDSCGGVHRASEPCEPYAVTVAQMEALADSTPQWVEKLCLQGKYAKVAKAIKMAIEGMDGWPAERLARMPQPQWDAYMRMMRMTEAEIVAELAQKYPKRQP